MKQLLLLLLCTCACSCVVFSQSAELNSVDAVAGNFIKQLQKKDQEKIFVHTSKWYYTAGESIWLKAYCINAFSHKPATGSKTLFLDLVNNQDSVVQTVFLHIAAHATDAAIRLPSSVKEGYYWLRAYTKKMLRDDKNSVFVQPLYIINSNEPLQASNQEITNTATDNTGIPEINFFPEGGSIISGSDNVIGFRATDKTGKPVAVAGYITDNWDTVVAKFTTGFAGMGKFILPAWKVRKYTAHINWQDKKDLKYPLPLIDQFASQLSVTNQNTSNIHVVVSLGDSLYKKNKQTCLVAVNRDNLLFAGIGRDMYELDIATKNFPEGKTQLILFNEQQQVVSERSVFIPRRTLLTVVADKENYKPREKATLTVMVGDSVNHPAAALMSVAISDDKQADEKMDAGFIKNLLQDNISLPADSMLMDNYNPGDQDLIMLTQKPAYIGWKNNKEINTIQQDAIAEDDSSITGIGGSVINNKGVPDANQVVTLLANNKVSIINSATTDANGRFYFNLPPGADSLEFTLQVTDARNKIKEEKIVADGPPLIRFSTPAALKKKFTPAETTVINRFKTSHPDLFAGSKDTAYLKEVKIVRDLNKGIDPRKRLSSTSHLIVFGEKERDNPLSTNNLILSSPGVTLRMGMLTLSGGPTDMKAPGAKDEPLIVLDGVALLNSASDVPGEPSPDLAYLSSIATNTIDFIEVLSGSDGSMFGVRGAHGVIVINTLSDLRSKESSGGTGKLINIHKGYANPVAFETPDYSLKEYKKSTAADLRSTIFWTPNLLTGKDGKASIHFYTADDATTYTATFMGISSEGVIIYKKVKLNRK